MTVGYRTASFNIDLEKEECRNTMKTGVIVQSLPSVNPNDYFTIVITPNKQRATMKVTKTPNPDTIEYFRDFEAQVRIDFSDPDCEPSIGGTQRFISLFMVQPLQLWGVKNRFLSKRFFSSIFF